jgi:phage gp16-like protein
MMKPTKPDALRKSELAIIHVAKKQLALEDDEYRSIMLTVTGKRSSADLDDVGRKALLDHFKKIGFKSKSGGHKRPTVGDDREPRMRKIEALLADRKLPWKYADGMARNICKKESISFCDGQDLGKIIVALVQDAKRRKAQ